MGFVVEGPEGISIDPNQRQEHRILFGVKLYVTLSVRINLLKHQDLTQPVIPGRRNACRDLPDKGLDLPLLAARFSVLRLKCKSP
jgi:hypothetical protein